MVPEETIEANVPKVTVSAAMDVPNFPVGTMLTNRRAIADALIARQEVLGKARGGGVSMEKVPVAHFSYEVRLLPWSTWKKNR